MADNEMTTAQQEQLSTDLETLYLRIKEHGVTNGLKSTMAEIGVTRYKAAFGAWEDQE